MKKRRFLPVFLSILVACILCFKFAPNREERAAAALFCSQLQQFKNAHFQTVTSFSQYLLPLSGLSERALKFEGLNTNLHKPSVFLNTAQLYFGTDQYANPSNPRITYAALRFVVPSINQAQVHEILDIFLQEYGTPQSVRINNDYTDIEGVAATLETKDAQESYKLFYDWTDLSIDGCTIDFHINVDYHPMENPQNDYGHIQLTYFLPYGRQIEN